MLFILKKKENENRVKIEEKYCLKQKRANLIYSTQNLCHNNVNLGKTVEG